VAAHPHHGAGVDHTYGGIVTHCTLFGFPTVHQFHTYTDLHTAHRSLLDLLHRCYTWTARFVWMVPHVDHTALLVGWSVLLHSSYHTTVQVHMDLVRFCTTTLMVGFTAHQFSLAVMHGSLFTGSVSYLHWFHVGLHHCAHHCTTTHTPPPHHTFNSSGFTHMVRVMVTLLSVRYHTCTVSGYTRHHVHTTYVFLVLRSLLHTTWLVHGHHTRFRTCHYTTLPTTAVTTPAVYTVHSSTRVWCSTPRTGFTIHVFTDTPPVILLRWLVLHAVHCPGSLDTTHGYTTPPRCSGSVFTLRSPT